MLLLLIALVELNSGRYCLLKRDAVNGSFVNNYRHVTSSCQIGIIKTKVAKYKRESRVKRQGAKAVLCINNEKRRCCDHIFICFVCLFVTVESKFLISWMLSDK